MSKFNPDSVTIEFEPRKRELCIKTYTKGAVEGREPVDYKFYKLRATIDFLSILADEHSIDIEDVIFMTLRSLSHPEVNKIVSRNISGMTMDGKNKIERTEFEIDSKEFDSKKVIFQS